MQRIVASFTLASLSLMAAYAILATWPPKLAKADNAALTAAASKDAHANVRAGSADCRISHLIFSHHDRGAAARRSRSLIASPKPCAGIGMTAILSVPV